MKLSKTQQQFILHWGEMGAKWGVNRTIAQIHALLYLSDQPLTAEEITETLHVARSNVSNSIKELLSWKLIRTELILGDRREHFTTSHDVWELAKLIIQGRIQRELEPTLAFLGELINIAKTENESKTTRQHLEQTEDFIKILTIWINEMVQQDPKTLMKILKYGAKLVNLKQSFNHKSMKLLDKD